VRIDLHSHSTVSDGTEPPAEVVASAARAGIDVLALTDHDSAGGWAEAAQAAGAAGLVLVPGAEISCQHRGVSVHLLSYLHDPAAPGLLAETERSRESREHRAERIVERIAQDYPLTWPDVLEHVRDGATIGRPHIADALVAKGLFRTRDEVFATVLGDGSPYYVPHYAPDVVTAVALVRQAGGVPVFAHPFAHRRGRTVGEDVIEAMAAAGLGGLEVDHRDHDAAARARLRQIAADLDLFVTGASDYHGDGKPNRLGENTTDASVLAQIVEQGHGSAVFRP
jgi:predicted metal-dependent phosphoesterase TrpH